MSDRGREFLNETMKDLCAFLGLDHQPTSSYHPQSNSQAETYNKTMIRYLSTALDNNSTLDWEDLLPAMAMCYNCHVQRATQESPFFLTYLHSPRLPYFDLENPRKLYGENYVSDAYRNMTFSWKLCKENLESAKKARETYFNRRAKRRKFSIGKVSKGA